MILGSGLGSMGDEVQNAVAVSYADIPHFRCPLRGPQGRLVFGTLEGKKLPYAGPHAPLRGAIPMRKYPTPVRAAPAGRKDPHRHKRGGLCQHLLDPGDLMLITDHIKYSWSLPCAAPTFRSLACVFPDASKFLYRRCVRQPWKRQKTGHSLQEGAYMYFPGPSMKPRRRSAPQRILGADAVGMSTAPEVITAGHCGMQVLGLYFAHQRWPAGILDKPLSDGRFWMPAKMPGKILTFGAGVPR